MKFLLDLGITVTVLFVLAPLASLPFLYLLSLKGKEMMRKNPGLTCADFRNGNYTK